MGHIAEHILGGDAAKKRPDYGVAKDMVQKGCMTPGAYDEYSRYSERPTSWGLRAPDYVPTDKKAKKDAAERANNCVVVRTSRREMRESQVAKSQRRRNK